MIDLTKLQNPPIRVTWEDKEHNFSKEKIARVKKYFMDKYNTTNVNIITKSTTESFDSTMSDIDISQNILDINYQYKLIDEFLKLNDIEDIKENIYKLDKFVEKKIVADTSVNLKHKKWEILNIEFSNFLSYGEKQRLDFTKLDGIIAIESTPKNFGGKTTLIVDLLMFLYFGTTTKSKVNADIFNLYSNKDTVTVKGESLIDGEHYIIERIMTRKFSKKSNKYNVKNVLNFYKKLPNGDILELKDEQTEKTSKIINDNIGTIDDFLMTILTTSDNLESLIKAKPTMRGETIQRFLGLEHLMKKEAIAREVYNTFAKSMVSNLYNIDSLNEEIISYKEDISDKKTDNEEFEMNSLNLEKRIKNGNNYRDTLIGKKHKIERDILLIKPQQLESEISDIKEKINRKNIEINGVILSKPTQTYDENSHDIILDNIKSNEREKSKLVFDRDLLNKFFIQTNSDRLNTFNGPIVTDEEISNQQSEIDIYKNRKNVINNHIQIISKEIDSIDTESLCEFCGVSLLETAFIKQKQIELDKYNKELLEVINTINKLTLNLDKLKEDKFNYERFTKTNEIIELEKKISIIDKDINNLEVQSRQYKNIKKNYDDYEKNKIIKDRLELDRERFELELTKALNKLELYKSNKTKIEENNKLDIDIIKSENVINDLNLELKNLHNRIIANNGEIKNLNEKIDSANSKIEKIKEEHEKEKVYKTYIMLYGKNGINKMIIKDMLPLINNELNNLLIDSAEFSIKVEINDKNQVDFHMVDNSTGLTKDISTGSGFEKTVSSIAIRAVLAKVCSLPKPNVIVFDEVFGKIADENVEKVLDLFQKIKIYFDKIFLISHNQLISQLSDRLIKVEKKDKISKIL